DQPLRLGLEFALLLRQALQLRLALGLVEFLLRLAHLLAQHRLALGELAELVLELALVRDALAQPGRAALGQLLDQLLQRPDGPVRRRGPTSSLRRRCWLRRASASSRTSRESLACSRRCSSSPTVFSTSSWRRRAAVRPSFSSLRSPGLAASAWAAASCFRG